MLALFKVASIHVFRWLTRSDYRAALRSRYGNGLWAWLRAC